MRKATFAVALTAWLIGAVALAFFGPVAITGIVVLMWRPAALLGFAAVALTLVAAFAGLPFAAMLTSGRSPRVSLSLSVLGLLAALVLAAASFAVAEVLPAMSASHHDDPGPPPNCMPRAPSIDATGSPCASRDGFLITPCPEGYSCTIGPAPQTCEIHCRWDCECPAPSRCVAGACRR